VEREKAVPIAAARPGDAAISVNSAASTASTSAQFTTWNASADSPLAWAPPRTGTGDLSGRT